MTAAARNISGGGHVPVMIDQVVALLQPRDGAIIVDGTFGGGGYSRAFLGAADCRVWAIDRDPDAIARGAAMEEEFGDRLKLVAGRFGDMARLLDIRDVAGVALDLGLSSPQLDDAHRGFSFQHDGPLDMRMSQDGPSAADVVNSMAENELADIIYKYGEERRSRRVAHAIGEARRNRPITRTAELSEIVAHAVPRAKDGLHPATRTFQALRIYVNDEMGELRRGLEAAEALLAAGGRLAVVAFHSLEDRAVKDFLKLRSGRAPRPSRHLPEGANGREATFRLLGGKPIRPETSEISANPRARSARLRAAERTPAPAWPQEIPQ
ncbi:MAG: 16S rRNA (cytosine(1402)-N(4))-methyltransferase RsmH [Alphaproteobacteria bacterium]|nr:16S rRNA (cytosine(1402)-N(4))-methyltransferase RsmH [Alphaproteobacteria bacterium]